MLNWLRKLLNASPENPSTNLANPADWLVDWMGGGGFSDAGLLVSKRSAMQVTAVFRCVSILANTVASLPLVVYRRTADGKEPWPAHPAYKLLHDTPNDRMTSMTFRELLMVSLLLDGNGYAPIRWAGNGYPTEIVISLPERTEVFLTESGRLAYRITDESGGQSVVTASNMIHVPGIGFDGLKGMSVISAVARQSVGLALAMDGSLSRLHANGARPSGAVEAEAALSADAFKRLKAQFDALYSGVANAGKTVFLDKGMKFNPIQINPVDAQTLESRRFQVTDIARIFGVPPHMIGETDKATSWGTGIEQMTIGFVQYSLRPWLVRIEQELNRKLFGREFFCEFNLDGLLRGDSKTRAEFYASGIQNGWIKPNEARKLENLPPEPGTGDKLYANGTLQPLEVAGNASPEPTQE